MAVIKHGGVRGMVGHGGVLDLADIERNAREVLERARAEAERIRAEACEQAQQDAAARQAAVQAALVGAAQTPLATAEKAVAALRLLLPVARDGNPNARTDAAVGALMAEAATRGAALNVRANVRDIDDNEVATQLAVAINVLEAEAATLAAEVVALAS